MRVSVVLLPLLFLLVGPARTLPADDEPPSRRVHELEIKLRFAEERLALHKTRSAHLLQMLEEMQEALKAARAETSVACQALKRQADQLIQQLQVEQERHVEDVMQLQSELSRANESAESNRIRAMQALQDLAVTKEENSRLREQVTLLEKKLAR